VQAWPAPFKQTPALEQVFGYPQAAATAQEAPAPPQMPPEQLPYWQSVFDVHLAPE
jgi:hypothetical protein